MYYNFKTMNQGTNKVLILLLFYYMSCKQPQKPEKLDFFYCTSIKQLSVIISRKVQVHELTANILCII